MNYSHLKCISYFIYKKKDFTIRFTKTNNIAVPHIGFIVSITPLINVDMNLKSIITYVDNNKYITLYGKIYEIYIGGWFENHKFYPDISIVENDIKIATNIGKLCNQVAIYDIENKITIFL